MRREAEMKALIVALSLTFIALPAVAEDRNPDGILHAPTMTILGGLQSGSDTYNVWEDRDSFSSRGDLSGTLLMGEIIYPTTKNLSLIFRFTGNWQKLEHPSSSNFYQTENTLSGYSLMFGIRLFSK
ncbi:MAG: hypothetical protein WBF13_00105 [Candidatus Zixiibacteriota bacterium]